MQEMGGVDKWDINKKAMQYVQNASSKRKEALETKKKSVEKEKNDRKRVFDEIIKITWSVGAPPQARVNKLYQT